MLTDILEVHFLECPKFRAMTYDLNNPLHRWLLFLDEKITKQQLEELISMDSTIKTAEERLLRLSCDEETLRLYEAREEAFIEHNSSMNAARRAGTKAGHEIGIKEGIQKGMEQGIQQGMEQGVQKGLQQGISEGKLKGILEGKQDIARNMLSMGLDIGAVAKYTGLSADEVNKLINEA